MDIFKKDLKTFLFNKDVNFLKFFFTYLFTIYMVNLIYLYLIWLVQLILSLANGPALCLSPFSATVLFECD